MNRREVICWMDTEFSGPDPNHDAILEVAGLLTDTDGNVISDSYHALLRVQNLPQVIEDAGIHVQKMHEKSGLWEDLWCDNALTTTAVDNAMCAWLMQFTDAEDIKYLGGNTVTLDRNHIAAAFPKFYQKLSYRSIDATSLAIFLRLHMNGGQHPVYRKAPKHRALSDVQDSIAEYQYYVALQKELTGQQAT